MTSIKNSVQLIGNLGAEVTQVKTKNDSPMVKFPLATNDYYTDSAGEKVTQTEWHNIVAYGKKAENMSKLLDKGSNVLIRGKITYNSYEDKEGVKKYTTSIVAEEFIKMN